MDLLSIKHIPRYHYIFQEKSISAVKLHSLCDTSEEAYVPVVHVRKTDCDGSVQVTLVMLTTKVVPIKKLIISCLELCGAFILADLLHYGIPHFHVVKHMC